MFSGIEFSGEMRVVVGSYFQVKCVFSGIEFSGEMRV